MRTQMHNDTAPYETTDLGVVAFVIYQGHQPTQIRQDSRHMTVFAFGPEVRAEVARYYAREPVEALKFVTCMNTARAMMRTLWPSREPKKPKGIGRMADALGSQKTSS